MIRRALRNIVLDWQRFRREERAVAAVEFALILPLLLTLYFGSMEAAAAFVADKRVNSVSATVGDLVSQWDTASGAMPNATWNDYMAASVAIIAPFPTSNLKVVVSLVQVKADGTTKVLWSKANAAGTAKSVNSAYVGLEAATMMNQVARGGCVVAAETSYQYLPMLGQVINRTLTLKHTNFFLPRYGSQVALTLADKVVANTACTAA